MVVPLVALGFAIGVQRGAAYDMGFDSACDEIDLLEVQGDYPRGHLSRFASIYTTGRGNYTISYPEQQHRAGPAAGQRPVDPRRGRDDIDLAVGAGARRCSDLPVQPRSLSLFRAEEMATLAGAIRLEGDGAGRRVVNGSELELRDATLIDITGPDREQWKERLPGDDRRRAARSRSARRPRAKAPETDRCGAGPGPEHVPPRRADDLGAPRRELRRDPAGRLGGADDARPGDRAAGGPPARVHRRARPPPQRPAARARTAPHYNILATRPGEAASDDRHRARDATHMQRREDADRAEEAGGNRADRRQ